MDVILLIVGVVCIALGGALGWFAGARRAKEWQTRFSERDAEARDLDEKFRKAIGELAIMSERADRAADLAGRLDRSESGRMAAESTLAGLRGEGTEREKILVSLREDLAAVRERHAQAEQACAAAEKTLAALRSEQAEREKAVEDRFRDQEAHFAREMKRLVEAEEKLQAKFNEIGEKLLTGAQAKFLDSAQARFETLNKDSLVALEKKVGPVGEALERYRKQVEKVEKDRTEAYHQLNGVIGEVRAGQERVLDSANRITTTLRGATKARGDWGELQLLNLLESCQLTSRTDFDCQVSVNGQDGALRPDAVINIPGNKRLVVDVKNVFNSYAAANEADSEEQRRELLRAHVRDLKLHIDDLSSKRYQDHVEGSADFVVMFVPGEHVLYTALSQDSSLLEYALQRNVVLSSPLNFMSIALTVATIWRQSGMQADAREIAELGKELYDRLARMGSLLAKVGNDLARTNKSFNSAVASFESRLVPTGRKFEQLSVDTSALQMEEPAPLEIEPRQLIHTDGANEISEE